MKLKFFDKYYGDVGEKSYLQDINKDNLYIGDVVNVKCKNMPDFLSVIVKDGDEKSYASMEAGDEVHNVKYVDDTEDTQKEEKNQRKKDLSPDKALKALIGMLVIADILGIGEDSDDNELEHD